MKLFATYAIAIGVLAALACHWLMQAVPELWWWSFVFIGWPIGYVGRRIWNWSRR